MELDESFDFGFTTHSEEEVQAPNVDRAQQIYNAVMPLLTNLKKDADTNPYIHWPNRGEKIEQFIEKLNTILQS